MRAGTAPDDFKRQPTLPGLEYQGSTGMKPISRQTTQTDIYSLDSRLPTGNTSNSTDGLQREPTVPNVFSTSQWPQPPSRSITQNSTQSDASFADDAPLISSAAPLGYGAPRSNGPLSRMDSERTLHSYKPPGRRFTGATQASQRSYGFSSLPMGPLSRQNSDRSEKSMPAPGPPPPRVRKPMPQGMSFDPRMHTRGPPAPGVDRSAAQKYEMQSQYPKAMMNRPPSNNSGYVAFNPNKQKSGHTAVPALYPAPSSGVPPRRNLTQPQRAPPMDYFGTNQGPPQRSGTAPLPAASYDNALIDAYGGSWQQPRTGPVPYGPATAGPGAGRQMLSRS